MDKPERQVNLTERTFGNRIIGLIFALIVGGSVWYMMYVLLLVVLEWVTRHA